MTANKDKKRGNLRRIDDLGRIVIPMDIRKRLHINNSDYLEIMATDTDIVIKKLENSCIFCGERADLTQFKETTICKKCLNEICDANK